MSRNHRLRRTRYAKRSIRKHTDSQARSLSSCSAASSQGVYVYVCLTVTKQKKIQTALSVVGNGSLTTPCGARCPFSLPLPLHSCISRLEPNAPGRCLRHVYSHHICFCVRAAERVVVDHSNTFLVKGIRVPPGQSRSARWTGIFMPCLLMHSSS